MTCDACGGWWALKPADHDCMAPTVTVLCLLGFVWTLQPDGTWLATEALPHVR